MKDGFVKVAAGSPVVCPADCQANARYTVDMIKQASDSGVHVMVFPELGLTGYTCADLFLQQTLLEGALQALDAVVQASRFHEMLIVVGLPVPVGSRLCNCAAIVYKGSVLGVVPKTHIPNYQEFYEQRWFSPAPQGIDSIRLGSREVPFGTNLLFHPSGLPSLCIAVEICEDLWVPSPPSVRHALAGATLVVNLSASDELVGKAEYRRQLVCGQSGRLVCAYVYAGAGTGESSTDLVFSGCSLIAENGLLLASRCDAEQDFISADIDVQRLEGERRKLTTFADPAHDGTEMQYRRMAFSLPVSDTLVNRKFSRHPFVPDEGPDRDARCATILGLQASGLATRVRHVGAKRVVVGLSGGLDSTLALLVCARAFDRLGLPRDGIIAVTMPCFGTTSRTLGNARALAAAMGASLREIDVSAAVRQHFSDLGHDEAVHDVVYENSQARERTQVLMDLANKEHALVVGTGDLSELALGWATYNGDHMSMYAVNVSVPKTLVRHLVAYHARTQADDSLAVVLGDVLDTPVSPELLPAAPDGTIAQVTEDIVGPYELHDFFLYHMVRWGCSPAKILRIALASFAGSYGRQELVKWLTVFCSRFFSQQFKRSCMPDGPKVGSVSLSPRGDWRMSSDSSPSLWLRELESL